MRIRAHRRQTRPAQAPDGPGPTRIVSFDVAGPVPDLEADDRWASAWVVAGRDGVPHAVAEIDLSLDAATVRARLEDVRARVDAAPERSETDDAPLDLPRISVVVPTIAERTDDLNRCLDELDRLVYPDYEVLLVDNRRTVPADDALPQLVRHRPRTRLVREGRPGISAARNAGVAAATGEIIAFTDDDVRVDPLWLQALGERFARHPQIEAVTGLILPAELETPAQIWFERYHGGFGGERTFAPVTLQVDRAGGHGRPGTSVVVRDDSGRETRHFAIYGAGAYGAGANMAFRRTAIERIGGFDMALGTGTPARGGEDLAAIIGVLWSGGQLGYEPRAIVHHRHRREVGELAHQLRGNGLGFTAMLSSLIRQDRRHVLGLASQLPVAARRMVSQSATRMKGGRGPARDAVDAVPAARYPSKLVWYELQGYPQGPLAYARSLRSARAWASSHPESAATGSRP